MMFDFFISYQDEILIQTLQHLKITLIALFFAILIGLSIGILLSRFSRFSGFTLGVLGVIQTIPSLALLGFMLPFLGIGIIPAITALFLYALLPIVRNTFTGIQEVDAGIVEAAKGMGMSNRQILWKVELPLSMPVIFAGIRTATVINVGVATLCALIAAGGLGEFIFRGIALNNMQMVLAGAIPSALLALSLDLSLAFVQPHAQKFIKPITFGFSLMICFILCYNFLPYFSEKNEFKAAFDAEFLERADGFKALKKHYGIGTKIETFEFDASLMYQALKEEKVDLIGGYSTDGRIDAYNLQILEDDKNYFPPYYACPLVYGKTLQKYPELVKVFQKIEGRISDEAMRKLNFEVDGQQRKPSEVAGEFLKKEGFNTNIVRRGKGDIKIGGKKFTEQYILIEIFKLLIENYTTLTVELNPGLGGTQIAFEALQRGEIDIYPEYTGTGLFVILKTEESVYKPFIMDKEKVYQYVDKSTQERFSCVWLGSLGFNNSYALMMRKEDCEQYNIQNISDLKLYLTGK